MKLTRNPKILVGSAIIFTACAFMFAVYGTHSHVPLPIVVVYGFSLNIGGTLQTWGLVEDKKRNNPPVDQLTTR
jgi:hypothetical protein